MLKFPVYLLPAPNSATTERVWGLPVGTLTRASAPTLRSRAAEVSGLRLKFKDSMQNMLVPQLRDFVDAQSGVGLHFYRDRGPFPTLYADAPQSYGVLYTRGGPDSTADETLIAFHQRAVGASARSAPAPFWNAELLQFEVFAFFQDAILPQPSP